MTCYGGTLTGNKMHNSCEGVENRPRWREDRAKRMYRDSNQDRDRNVGKARDRDKSTFIYTQYDLHKRVAIL